jgi:hypothetical protein
MQDIIIIIITTTTTTTTTTITTITTTELSNNSNESKLYSYRNKHETKFHKYFILPFSTQHNFTCCSSLTHSLFENKVLKKIFGPLCLMTCYAPNYDDQIVDDKMGRVSRRR